MVVVRIRFPINLPLSNKNHTETGSTGDHNDAIPEWIRFYSLAE